MSKYDDVALDAARQKALGVGRKLFKDQPGFWEPIPELLKSDGDVCANFFDKAQGAYAAAADALFSGSKSDWINSMAAGAFWEGEYNRCIRHLK